jgi:hypothetical protein
MSSYGTSEDYCTGYDEAADETAALYAPLMKALAQLKAARDSGEPAPDDRAVWAAFEAIPAAGRRSLDSTTRGTA